jgi:hypothetical protein
MQLLKKMEWLEYRSCNQTLFYVWIEDPWGAYSDWREGQVHLLMMKVTIHSHSSSMTFSEQEIATVKLMLEAMTHPGARGTRTKSETYFSQITVMKFVPDKASCQIVLFLQQVLEIETADHCQATDHSRKHSIDPEHCQLGHPWQEGC